MENNEINQPARAHSQKTQQDINAGILKEYIAREVEAVKKRIENFELSIPAGSRRRRSGYDMLADAGHFTADFIFAEYPKILAKVSTLSRTARETVREVGDIALANYIRDRRRKKEEAGKEQQTKQ